MKLEVTGKWLVPPIQHHPELGKIEQDEMNRVFNMGIGMACVVAAEDADRTAALFAAQGVKAHLVGEVVRA